LYFKQNQQDATLHYGIYYYKFSTRFRRFLRPSSGAQNVSELGLGSNSLTLAVISRKSSTNTRCCIYIFLAPDDGLRKCLKHVEHL